MLTFAFLIFILFNFHSFINNIWFYASGSVAAITIKGEWWFALLNIGLFLSLFLFVGRKQADWKTSGLFAAFIVSLFIEMYGAPLLIYLAAGNSLLPPPHDIVFYLDFFGIRLGFDFWMAFGSLVITIGMAIIVLGWHQLWASRQSLFTEGFYRYSRHPQYVGFLYVIWGWAIAWPTIITLAFAPILTWAYIHAAIKEEKFILGTNPEYKGYMEKTPFMM